jgi:SAM-dependent methyltransferase
MLGSNVCRQSQLETPEFEEWCSQIKERVGQMHRKIWEWCFIAQALFERGMLVEGRRGLGFAVGQEPLVDSNQHSADISRLNTRDICDKDVFQRRVSFRTVDMNRVPSELAGFDFVWSSCAIEHVGSLDKAIAFMERMVDCLKPGGVAVHTTEYNLSSETETLVDGNSVIFRKSDLRKLVEKLTKRGCRVEPLDFEVGQGPADLVVDEPPYTHDPHLRLMIGPYLSTSFGIIVTKL